MTANGVQPPIIIQPSQVPSADGIEEVQGLINSINRYQPHWVTKVLCTVTIVGLIYLGVRAYQQEKAVSELTRKVINPNFKVRNPEAYELGISCLATINTNPKLTPEQMKAQWEQANDLVTEYTVKVTASLQKIFGNQLNNKEFREKILPYYITFAEQLNYDELENADVFFPILPTANTHIENHKIDFTKVFLLKSELEGHANRLPPIQLDRARFIEELASSYCNTTDRLDAGITPEMILGQISATAIAMVSFLKTIKEEWVKPEYKHTQKKLVFAYAILLLCGKGSDELPNNLSFVNECLKQRPREFCIAMDNWRNSNTESPEAFIRRQKHLNNQKNNLI